MAEFTTPCPHCQSPVVYYASLAGTAVACSHCRGQFHMPTPDVPRQSQHVEQGTSPALISAAQRAVKQLSYISLWLAIMAILSLISAAAGAWLWIAMMSIGVPALPG